MIETTKTGRQRKMAREAQPAPNGNYTAAPDIHKPAFETPAAPTAIKTQTKASLVQKLLARDAGASLAELCEATGWLPHTCRAFLTGLRKRGQSLEKARREDGVTCYHLPSVEVAA